MKSTLENVSRRVDVKRFLLSYGMYLVFIAMIIAFSFVNENFFKADNFFLILQQLSPLGIAAIGMSFVLITAGIDISVGKVMYLSGVLVGEAILALPSNVLSSWMLYPICFGIVIATGASFGFFNGMLITKLKIFPFITTLVTGFIARGIGLTIAGLAKYDVRVLTPFANGRIAGFPVVTIFFFILLIIMNYVLRQTRFGKNTMAIGNNKVAASHIGINVDRHLIKVYIISGVAAGVAGLLSAGQISEVYNTFGEGNEFIIISAAVIGGNSLFGGKGSILPGALIGMLLIQLLLNGLSMMNASIYIFNVVRGLVIFLAVMLDSINNRGELR